MTPIFQTTKMKKKGKKKKWNWWVKMGRYIVSRAQLTRYTWDCVIWLSEYSTTQSAWKTEILLFDRSSLETGPPSIHTHLDFDKSWCCCTNKTLHALPDVVCRPGVLSRPLLHHIDAMHTLNARQCRQTDIQTDICTQQSTKEERNSKQDINEAYTTCNNTHCVL